ncbi:MAG: hypothetical protein Fur0020_01040 [Thermodesulfovibrionia bacterium]
MVEFGRIERPDVSSFLGKKKLYYVPNIYPVEDAEEYNSLVNRFWEEAERQLERLEVAGRVTKILCESIHGHGEEALNSLATMNEKAHALIKKKIEGGATILPIDDKDILDTFIDWRNCLAIARSREVSSKVYEFYKEAFEKRIKHIQDVIESNLSSGESALLILGDEIRVKLQLSKEIELFLVMPPSYDDLMKWLRDRLMKVNK